MIFDGHSDILAHIADLRINKNDEDCFRKYHLESFQEGSISSSIFAIWENKLTENYEKLSAEQIVESLKAELIDAEDIINVVKSFQDFEIGKNQNKINIVVGIEGLEHIKTDLSRLDYYYEEVFVRHASLTWNESNDLATGVKGDDNRGLTEYGRNAIKRMEHLGMVVDVSHLNEKSFSDVSKVCTKPIIASHSNCKSLCSVPRNLTDNQIKFIAESGGIIGLNAYSKFISNDVEFQTVSMLAKHATHIADLVGVEYVGFGFDFLSYFEANLNDVGTKGINSAAEAPNMIVALKAEGFSDCDIKKIAYENFENVFKVCVK